MVPYSNVPPGVRFLSLTLQITFILLLELLVSSTLPQIGKDLGELADDNVICGQCGLGLKNPKKQECYPTEQETLHVFIHLLNKLKGKLKLAR